MLFDYQDLYYNNENPLIFLLKNEMNHHLRKNFYSLNEIERFIIEQIIIKEKSLINTALLLDMNVVEVKEKLDITLEVLYRLFQQSYLL